MFYRVIQNIKVAQFLRDNVGLIVFSWSHHALWLSVRNRCTKNDEATTRHTGWADDAWFRPWRRDPLSASRSQ